MTVNTAESTQLTAQEPPLLSKTDIRKIINEHLRQITHLQKTLELEEQKLLHWMQISKRSGFRYSV